MFCGGGMHGVGIVANHMFRERGFRMPRWLGILLTFVFVNFAWVLFRAESVSQALLLYKSMFSFSDWHAMLQYVSAAMPGGRKEILVELLFFAMAVFLPNSREIVCRMQSNYKWAVVAGLLLSIAIMALHRDTAFLYYQF